MNLISYVKGIAGSIRLKHAVRQMKAVATIKEPFASMLGATIINETRDDSRIVIGPSCRLNGVLTCTGNGRITIGSFSTIQIGTRIYSANSIKIGSFTGIAENTMVVDTNTHSTDFEEWIEHRIRVAPGGVGYSGLGYGWEKAESAPVTIGDAVWIGGGCTILKGVTIGDGAIVARASVVTRDVEPFTLVAGNPAKKVKDLRKPDRPLAEVARDIMSGLK